MQPMGRKKLRFPSKTKEWLGKGVMMWWEDICSVSKKRERSQAKQKVLRDLVDD